MRARILVVIGLLLLVHGVGVAQSQYSLAKCESPAKARDMLGQSLKLKVDKEAIVKKDRDIDYSSYAVGFGKKDSAWLHGIYGPNATSGAAPPEWLSASSEVSRRTWKFADVKGVDAKGKLANGNYWRYVGMFGESIKYYNVPPDAAAYFDRIIDSMCFMDTLFPITSLFKDVAQQAGLKFQHYNGMTGKFYLPEITGSGGALFDFDNDGDLDVFLVQGNVLEPNTQPHNTLFPWRGPEPPRGKLFRNDLSKAGLSFADVTQQSGIVATGYGMGAAVGDINNDGLPDLYLSNLGSNQMYLNKGAGKFVDVTKESGTDDPRWTTSASFLDYDRDGRLDLMIVNYADFSVTNNPACYAATTAKDYCTPRVFRAPGNRLFRNKGDGVFEDVTIAAGVNKEFGHGLGVVTADFNKDGWIDIYVANDGDPNQLWTNQQNGTFVNEALLAGCAVNRNGQAEAGMGVDAADFDGNATDDIFITHLMDETNTLYVNLGGALFEDRTREAGLGMPGRRFTGFGTFFFDYDNDGLLDLFVANGAVQLLPELVRQKNPFPLGQPNQLFRNTGQGSFVEIADEAGPEFSSLEVSRGAAFGDVDNDGDTDFLVMNNNGPARLFINQVGNRNHWLGLRLVGKSGRDMLGAQVEIVVADNKILHRRVRTDGSYLSASDPRVLVGLGAATRVKTVRVRWPDGAVEERNDISVDRYSTLQKLK